MTPDHAAKLLPVMQAFSEGKTVQCLSWNHSWVDWAYGDAIQVRDIAEPFVPQLCDARTEWRVKAEPVKPREFWLAPCDNGVFKVVSEAMTKYKTVPNVEGLRLGDTFKVVEVLE